MVCVDSTSARSRISRPASRVCTDYRIVSAVGPSELAWLSSFLLFSHQANMRLAPTYHHNQDCSERVNSDIPRLRKAWDHKYARTIDDA